MTGSAWSTWISSSWTSCSVVSITSSTTWICSSATTTDSSLTISAVSSMISVGTSTTSTDSSTVSADTSIDSSTVSIVSSETTSATSVLTTDFSDSTSTSSFSSSSELSSTGVSSNTVSSFNTTVSKWEKGLFIKSFKAGSGANETFVCPCISNRSPVFIFTLSRLSTSISLNVPKPLIFTYLSFSSDSSINWKNSFTKLSASALSMPCFSASNSIKFCIFSFSFIFMEDYLSKRGLLKLIFQSRAGSVC